ncbi:hypothetical protein M9H77_21869 [Catharanthus roseus]|uniref:Uncharacterized protein n=1 Tax=Catharanthus roseus TaxID=4058 RepID=A0ACC0AP90_CATRO|nr:hypothetical protein M9H77_21869 [Catharanthus roseus]
MSGTLRPISSCYEDFPEFQRISKSCIKGWGRMYRVEHFRQWMKMGNFEDSLHPSGFFRVNCLKSLIMSSDNIGNVDNDMVEESHVHRIKKDAYYVASADGPRLILTTVQLRETEKDNSRR